MANKSELVEVEFNYVVRIYIMIKKNATVSTFRSDDHRFIWCVKSVTATVRGTKTYNTATKARRAGIGWGRKHNMINKGTDHIKSS